MKQKIGALIFIAILSTIFAGFHGIQLPMHDSQLSLERVPLINTDAINEDRKDCYYSSSNCRPITIYGIPPIYVGFVFFFFGAMLMCLSLYGFAIQLGQTNKCPHWLCPASIVVGMFAIYLLGHASNLILIGRYSLPLSPSASPDRRSELMMVASVCHVSHDARSEVMFPGLGIGFNAEPKAERNPVKPFGYPDLPFPEAPLGGAVLLIFGWWLSNIGIERGPFTFLMVGWILGVFGCAVLLLWIIPYIAGVVSPMLASVPA